MNKGQQTRPWCETNLTTHTHTPPHAAWVWGPLLLWPPHLLHSQHRQDGFRRTVLHAVLHWGTCVQSLQVWLLGEGPWGREDGYCLTVSTVTYACLLCTNCSVRCLNFALYTMYTYNLVPGRIPRKTFLLGKLRQLRCTKQR